MTTWVVLDVSPSMAFGTTERLKADVAEGAARVLARLATRRGGRVALVICGGRARARAAAARRAQAPAPRVEGALRAGVVPDGHGDPGRPRARAAPARADGPRCPAWWSWSPTSASQPEPGGARCARSPRATRCGDRGARPARGRAAGGRPPARWSTPRPGAQVEVDTRDRRLRERYAGRERAEREAVRAELRRAGVDHVVLSTDGPGCATRRAAAAREAGAGELPGAALPRRRWRSSRCRSPPTRWPAGARRRYAVRFTGVPTLAARRPRGARAGAGTCRPRCSPRARRRSRSRSRGREATVAVPGRAGLGPARDRRVGLDAGHRRGARPA